MTAPILFMLAAPTCPAGWHPVPGAQPSRAGDAVALVLPSLYPIESAEITGEQAAMLFAGMALHADLTPETAGSALFAAGYWMT